MKNTENRVSRNYKRQLFSLIFSTAKMVVDLLGGKKRFATLMDDIQPMVISQFIVWLDEKVAEFKCQGCMNLEINFEAPKWIKDYSMSMLISGAGITDSPNSSQESSPYSHSRPSPVSPQPPRRTQAAVTPLAAARRLQSQGSHSPASTERIRDVQMSSQRKRAARETDSPDLELIEVKKERLEEDLYVVEQSSSHAGRAGGRGNSRSVSLPYESVSDILEAVSAGSSAASLSNVIPPIVSSLATEPVVSYHYASSQSRKTIPSSNSSSLQDVNVSSDKRLVPYSESSRVGEETDVQSGLEMSADDDEQSGYYDEGDEQQVTYPGFDGDHESENGGDSSAFTDIKPAVSHSPSADSADAADPLSEMQLVKAGPSGGYSETDESPDANNRNELSTIAQSFEYPGGVLMQHIELIDNWRRNVSDQQERRKFVCNVCGVRYCDTRNLRQHQRVVHEGRFYTCDVCLKSFNSRQQRSVHKKSSIACQLPP